MTPTDQTVDTINRLTAEAFALELASGHRSLLPAEHERLTGLYAELHELQGQVSRITKDV